MYNEFMRKEAQEASLMQVSGLCGDCMQQKKN